MKELIIILIITAIVIYSGKKRVKIPGMGGEILSFIMVILVDVAGYLFFLLVLKTGFPEVLEAWQARDGFFLATNGALIVCILALTLPGKNKRWWGAVGIVILFFLVFNVIKQELKKSYYDNMPLPTQVAQPNPEDGNRNPQQHSSGKTSKLFNFTDDKRSITVYLKPGWKSYPKGGPITIQTPSGDILEDTPGVDSYFGYQPEGTYIISATSDETTGVELYNYWKQN